MGNRRNKFNDVAESVDNSYFSGSGGKYFNPEYDKQYVVRILPPIKDSGMDDIPYVPIGKHTIKSAGGNFTTIICPNISMTLHQPCPLCEASSDAYKDHDKETGRKLRAQARYLFNIIVRQTSINKSGSMVVHPEIEGPYIWDMPKTVFEDIKEIYNNTLISKINLANKGTEYEKEEEIVIDFTDIRKGVDVLVKRTHGDNGFPKYSIQPMLERSPLAWILEKNEEGESIKSIDKETTATVLDGRIDLSKHYNIPTVDEIKEFAVTNNLFAKSEETFEDFSAKVADVSATNVTFASDDDDDDDIMDLLKR